MSDPAARFLVRRRFLQLTGGALGLHLGGLWQARAATASRPTRTSVRSCILIFYYGGPSHLDTYDPKPDARPRSAASSAPSPPASPGSASASTCRGWPG